MLLDRVHGEFERRLGHWFGRVIVGSFQDELPVAAHLVGDVRRGVRRQARLRAVLRSASRRLAAPTSGTRAELAEEAFFRPLSSGTQRTAC